MRDKAYWEGWLRKNAESLRAKVASTRDWYKAAGVAKGERRLFRAAMKSLGEPTIPRKAGKFRRQREGPPSARGRSGSGEATVRAEGAAGTVRAGHVRFTRDGRPIVITEPGDEPAIRVARHALGGAWPRDKVLVSLSRRRGGAPPSGRVVRVVERGIRSLVGRYAPIDGRHFVRFRDRESDLLLPAEMGEGVAPEAGDLVRADVVEYPDGGREGRVRILESLGANHTMDTIAAAVTCARNLPARFSEASDREAARIPQAVRVVPAAEAGGGPRRADQRDLPFVTIDGEDARDFDDAVCLVRGREGARLLVAIADVSHYVAPGSGIDGDAFARGTSIYFPDRALPMLPPALSEGVCSLKPGVNRLAVTVEIPIDAHGRPGAASFYPSAIRSRARLTYDEVHAFLAGETETGAARIAPEVGRMLREMETLAGRLTLARASRGALDFDLPEWAISVEDGLPAAVSVAPRWESHRIVEEFMLLANAAVAEFLAGRDIPFLSRIHEPPSEKKLLEFEDAAARLLRKSRATDRRGVSERLRGWAAAARGGKFERQVNMLLLRSLMLARYGPEQKGHFGLALAQYTHFTSPIRRYPDLIVHRVLKAALGDRSLVPYVRTILENGGEIGEHLSARERGADDAARDVEKMAKALYMSSRVGRAFEGAISSVQPFGIFVELSGSGIEGFVHISTLRGDAFRYSPDRAELYGSVFRTRLGLGDRVRVKVRKTDVERGEIDLVFVEKIPDSL